MRKKVPLSASPTRGADSSTNRATAGAARGTAEGRAPVATRGIALDDPRGATLSTATATGHTEGTCVRAVASQYPQLRLHHHAHLEHLRRHDAGEEDTLQLRPVTARKAWSPWNVPWGDAEGASERGGGGTHAAQLAGHRRIRSDTCATCTGPQARRGTRGTRTAERRGEHSGSGRGGRGMRAKFIKCTEHGTVLRAAAGRHVKTIEI